MEWGPDPSAVSPIAEVRADIRSELRTQGHAAFLSEELYDSASLIPLRIQQIAHAQQFDLVVSIPSSRQGG